MRSSSKQICAALVGAVCLALTPAAFRELQAANRTLWEQWLSPLGAYRYIAEDAARGRHVTGSKQASA